VYMRGIIIVGTLLRCMRCQLLCLCNTLIGNGNALVR